MKRGSSSNLLLLRENSQSGEIGLNSMIEQNYSKKIRNRLFFLFSFVDTIPQNFYGIHAIISYWRIIQFIGPALAAPYLNFWEPNSKYSNTISILSILFHLIPPRNRSEASVIVEFIYFALLFGIFGFLIIYSFYFRKTAKISSFIAPIIIVFVNGILHLFQPIVIEIIGESIGRLSKNTNYFDFDTELAGIILSLIMIIIYFFFFTWISSVSFLFRPYSLMTVTSRPQSTFSVVTWVITFLTAVASQIDKTPRIILTAISAILYFLTILIIFEPGSFIDNMHSVIIFGASVCSGIFLILVIIYDIVGHHAVMIEVFVFFILLFLACIAGDFVFKKKLRDELQFIDEVYDHYETADQVINLNEKYFLRCAISGLTHSHPHCIDWSFFREGAEKFPNSRRIWKVFGKFVAIYPEEGSLLSLIIHKIQSARMKGYVIQEILSQAHTIMTQREGSLSVELKMRLTKAAKQVRVAKSKMRHIWDLAIQSSINEMDSSITSTYRSVTKAEANFSHLLSQYPNNRFVARQYSRFVIEILSDTALYSQWNDKVRILQKGVMVNSDRANILGMHAFPGLPVQTIQTMFKNTNNSPNNSQSLYDSDFMNDSSFDIEESLTQERSEQLAVIKDRINSISIPAINCIRAWMAILFFVFIFIPSIVMMVYAPIFLDSLTYPLDLMYDISYLRAAAFMMPMLARHCMLENTPDPKNSSRMFFPQPDYGDLQFMSFGQANTTFYQLANLISTTSNSVGTVSVYRTFAASDPNIQYAHDVVFGQTIPYKYVSSDDLDADSGHIHYSVVNISLQSAIMEIITHMTVFTESIPNGSLINSVHIIDPLLNSPTVAEYATYALACMRDYLKEKHADIDNIVLFAMMFLCIVYAVIIISLLIFQVENLRNTKYMIFECLTALPKNIVSTIAESLKIIEKNNSDSDNGYEKDTDNYEGQIAGLNDINKQDENIMKVFSSASDLSMLGSTERLVYIVLNLIILVCCLGIIVLLCEMLPIFSENLRDNAPHLDYVLGTVAYLGGSIESIESLVSRSYFQTNYDIEEKYNETLIRLINFTDFYHNARYGGDNSDQPSYNGFQAAHDNAKATFSCKDDEKIPTSFEEYYNCFSVDLQVNLLEPFFASLLIPLSVNKAFGIGNRNPMLTNLYVISMKAVDQLFYPMFREIVSKMKALLNDTIPTMRTPGIILLIVAFIAVIFVYIQTVKTQEKMKFALSLLLHCPPDVVMQTPKIMDILSGDFGSGSHDSLMKNTEFFDSVVKSIPDSVIVMNDNGIVESLNRATERIYGLKREEFIGTNAKTFFSSSKFSPETKTIFSTDVKMLNVEYKMTNEDNSYLQLKSIETPKSHILVIVTRDQTQTVSYNTLIAAEKAKSDKLLQSILPPLLIPRVQNGEENISFSVQSASICFMDIVEFTPWCAANTAQMIMSTLNLMFRYFDSSLATHSTLTKIKCIGDCYMGAGGIFVEVNQPAVHAKEMIEFGLEAINNVKRINQEKDMTLRIRVGVNTGGPIVAGVLGIDKPTFEILGPAINMAQQMEHHGVPMLVHISRSSYELIYSGGFDVKERGQIEIKNGTVRTYLVNGKKGETTK